MENYSQNDEQQYILDTFKGVKGRFLDIGAFDGKTISNTYALSLLGWKGVCVEPSPMNHGALINTYEGNPNIICLKQAVCHTDGEVTFYDTPNQPLGSLTKGNGERYGVRGEEITVLGISTESLFREVGYDFDFISLDVEQNNIDILKKIPFKKLTKLKLICVEHDTLYDEIINHLKPFGFKEIHRTGENILLKFENFI